MAVAALATRTLYRSVQPCFLRCGFQSWQGSTGLLSVKDVRLPSKLASFASQVHMFNKFMLFFVSLNALHHQMCNA